MSLGTRTASAAGDGLGALFSAVARIRGARGVHPSGRVLHGTVRREGLQPPTGVAWLDQPGEDDVLVRLSRGGGLPDALPDVLGIALRIPAVPGGDGFADLLLSTAGRAPGLRHVLAPQRDPRRAGYTSIVPFHTPSGPRMVGAFGDGLGFDLRVAAPAGPWRTFGRLTVGDEEGDAPTAFDPMLHPVPGLRMPETLVRLREPAYRASRRNRPGG